MIDALRAPCYALCVTMAGFSSIARESGFDFMMTLVTSLGVWGMPGQVAFASLYSAWGITVYHICRGFACQYADAANGNFCSRHDAP